jgi:hypothetical protein
VLVAGLVAGAPSGVVGCSAVHATSAGESTTTGPDGSGGGSAGATVDAASSCNASDVSTYVPSAYQAAAAPSNACLGSDGAGLWDAYYDACLAPTTQSEDACVAFRATAANAACATCILTPYASSRLGPIVDYGAFVGGNIAGCIEVETFGQLPCAKAVQALTECEIAACQANCPVSDEASLGAREACGMQADQAGCQPFFQAATACRAAEADAGVASSCSDTAFKDFFDQVVPSFCGQSAIAAFDASALDAAPTTPNDAGEVEDVELPALAVDAAAE